MRTPPRMPAILFAVALCAPAAASAQQTGGPPLAPTVDVSAPLAKRVANWDEFTGRFEASEQVEIRARVSGFIDAIHFRDGEAVDKGARLFTIDPRAYALALDAARAELVRAQSSSISQTTRSSARKG